MSSLSQRSIFPVVVTLAAIVLGLSTDLTAQSCSMCYQNAVATGREGVQALRQGILILLIPALSSFCGLWLLLYREARLRKKTESSLSESQVAHCMRTRPEAKTGTRVLALCSIAAACLCSVSSISQAQTGKTGSANVIDHEVQANKPLPPSDPSAPPQTQPSSSSSNSPHPTATYMGAEACSQCHYDKFVSYQNQPHSMSKDPRTPGAREGCENCHGPASNHVGGGGGRGVGGLMNFAKNVPTAAKNAPCLSCHTRGYVSLWHGSTHDQAKLACVDCHQIHGGNPKLLAQPTQQQLCTRCHQQIRVALLKSSHHPLREEKMFCTNCHNPHGTQTERLIAANSVNDKCYECHAEKRGPFIWEHPPARESCLNCHDPHGSSNEPLLVLKKPMLCQRCHSDAIHPGQLLAQPVRSRTTVYQQPPMLQYRSCTNCHVMIHGSNHPSGKFFHR